MTPVQRRKKKKQDNLNIETRYDSACLLNYFSKTYCSCTNLARCQFFIISSCGHYAIPLVSKSFPEVLGGAEHCETSIAPVPLPVDSDEGFRAHDHAHCPRQLPFEVQGIPQGCTRDNACRAQKALKRATEACSSRIATRLPRARDIGFRGYVSAYLTEI